MHDIWKYVLGITDKQVVKVPQHARFLTAQMQGGQLCLWAEVDPSAELVERCIAVYGTGQPITSKYREYIATVQSHSSALVWHIYEVRP